MSSESQRRFWCNFCCTSNTNASEGFAIVHLIILGMAEFFMFHGVDNDMYLNNNWPLLLWTTLIGAVRLLDSPEYVSSPTG